MTISINHSLCQKRTHREIYLLRYKLWYTVKCAGSLERLVASPHVVEGISPQPSVESSDLPGVNPSLTLNVLLTETDRGDGPISEARFLVPVCSESTGDFTDIVSILHLILSMELFQPRHIHLVGSKVTSYNWHPQGHSQHNLRGWEIGRPI